MKHILGFSCDTVSDCLIKANNPAFYSKLRELNLAQTKKDISSQIPCDVSILQTVHALEEITASLKRMRILLREFYSWYAPELCHIISDDELINNIVSPKGKLLSAMGAKPNENDLMMLKCTAESIVAITGRETLLSKSLAQSMQTLAPNLTAVAGILLGAKLLALSGGLKQLAFANSSFIQLLGAKKALFRHVITGAKNPKHGIIIEHPLIQTTTNKGQASRILSGKIVIAARIDYFKGLFVGVDLLKSVEVQLCKK
ncbi:MAG: hypothetical protein Q7K43_02730 [Candidatus Woesearchaeota archaeon]|nr:hypothetical protein [Candidatus Woesearchaeota archaeon]